MRRLSSVLALAALSIGLAHPVAAAAPAVVAWTTWLQAGPGNQTRVIDEIPGGWRVDVLACEAGWCRVVSDRAEGYVEQAMLATARTPEPAAAADPACFAGQYLTPEGSLPLRLCAAKGPTLPAFPTGQPAPP